jgi:hypothetical protein
MATIFEKFRGSRSTLAQARDAELRGALAHAMDLFMLAGRPDEAARVLILRGDAEANGAACLRHYTQAAAIAPRESAVAHQAQRKRLTAVVAMAKSGGATPAEGDLVRAASELEASGDYAHAAEAYALAGDVDSQARALTLAGDVDALEELLSRQQRQDLGALAVRRIADEMSLLLSIGRRREAVELARASNEGALRDRGEQVEAQRIAESVVRVTLRGTPMTIALGDAVVMGRAAAKEGGIGVASRAVSRRHIAVLRRGGAIVVRDLGGRNGTRLRGLALSGEATVGDGIELRLGDEVPVVVRPASELVGAAAIEVAGARYVAPLGPARLGVGRWRLERGKDEWVELITDDDPPAFAGSMRLAARVTLLAGDTMALERSSAAVLRVDRDR